MRNGFFTSDAVRNYNLWSCQKVCEALTFLSDNIYIKFASKLYRQIVGIPMGTYCDLLVADLFLFCYVSDFLARLFWFFGDFRCGVSLFIVIRVIYKYIKIGKNRC